MKKLEVNHEKVSEFGFVVRQVVAQGILAAGTVCFIMQNLDQFTGRTAQVLAGIVVFFILFFGNKR